MSGVNVLFICWGNICRSPMAKVVADAHAAREGLTGVTFTSAGVSAEETGHGMDPRAIATLEAAGVAGTLDQFGLREGGEQNHGGDPLLGNLLGGGDAVHDGHLDVHDHHVGAVLAGERHALFAVRALANNVVSTLAEGLDNVHADQRLVLRDNGATGTGGGLIRLLLLGSDISISHKR